MHRPAASLAALVFALIALSSSPASADVKTECIAAANEGQDLRLDGKLRAARLRLQACASSSCPQLLQSDCTKWLEDLDQRTPSIVVAAKRADGSDVVDARVLVDGVLVGERLDAKALALDPGAHVVRVELDATHVSTQTIVLAEGERGRIVTFHFGALESTAAATTTTPTTTRETPPEAVRSIQPLSWVSLGVSVVALSSFAYFGLSGRHDLDAIRATGCAPHCEQGPVDDAKKKLLVADLSLVVGVVSLGVATWSFLHPRVETSTQVVKVDLAPMRGGGFASIAASF